MVHNLFAASHQATKVCCPKATFPKKANPWKKCQVQLELVHFGCHIFATFFLVCLQKSLLHSEQTVTFFKQCNEPSMLQHKTNTWRNIPQCLGPEIFCHHQQRTEKSRTRSWQYKISCRKKASLNRAPPNAICHTCSTTFPFYFPTRGSLEFY